MYATHIAYLCAGTCSPNGHHAEQEQQQQQVLEQLSSGGHSYNCKHDSQAGDEREVASALKYGGSVFGFEIRFH